MTTNIVSQAKANEISNASKDELLKIAEEAGITEKMLSRSLRVVLMNGITNNEIPSTSYHEILEALKNEGRSYYRANAELQTK